MFSKRNFHSETFDEERPLIGHVFDLFCGRFAGAVAGAGFDADQHRRVARLRGLQRRGELEAVRRERRDRRGRPS